MCIKLVDACESVWFSVPQPTFTQTSFTWPPICFFLLRRFNYKLITGQDTSWLRKVLMLTTLTTLFLTMSARGLTTSTQNITTKRVVIHLVRFGGIQQAHIAIFMTLKWLWSPATIRHRIEIGQWVEKRGKCWKFEGNKNWSSFPLQNVLNTISYNSNAICLDSSWYFIDF